ncbi:hypothetical protein [Opitutus sp. ER46]|uniref:hypothetical protein n=1 Tax=Opitutus sp. ER46 TaxID=2161864 RepID=UPI000D32501E|nr:hypothetical protein [Opitutus sp. ER46]PTX97713.1 hypothetical protein DB354_05380 [Opitutus sp. ER46]
MTPRLLLPGLAALASAVAFGATPPAASPKSAPANAAAIEAGPAVGWTLPIFTDKEGYRQLTLRGSLARVISKDQIDVTGFSAVAFSGDASERVESVLLSPQASFFPRTNRATGKDTVRLIHDDIEVLGRDWTFEMIGGTKKVSIARDVRVTFQAQLNDILK